MSWLLHAMGWIGEASDGMAGKPRLRAKRLREASRCMSRQARNRCAWQGLPAPGINGEAGGARRAVSG